MLMLNCDRDLTIFQEKGLSTSRMEPFALFPLRNERAFYAVIDTQGVVNVIRCEHSYNITLPVVASLRTIGRPGFLLLALMRI